MFFIETNGGIKMFCQNCGKKIKENDVFCGSCGAKVITSSENAQKSSDDNENYRDSSMQNSEKDNGINHESYTQEHIDFKETVFGKVMHNYFKKPLSIFSLMKDEDTTKTSIGFLIGIPILYGLFHMLYFISFFKNIVNNVLYYVNKLSSILGSSYEEVDFYEYSDEISKIKNTIQTYISTNMEYPDYFFKGILVMFLMIAVTFIIVEICNATILKNSMNHKNILFISSIGFIPLLFAVILNNFVIYISFMATLIILILGFIMSLITIFSGVVQLNDERHDRAYWTMFINNVILMIIMPFIIKLGISSVLNTVAKIFKLMNKLF